MAECGTGRLDAGCDRVESPAGLVPEHDRAIGSGHRDSGAVGTDRDGCKRRPRPPDDPTYAAGVCVDDDSQPGRSDRDQQVRAPDECNRIDLDSEPNNAKRPQCACVAHDDGRTTDADRAGRDKHFPVLAKEQEEWDAAVR